MITAIARITDQMHDRLAQCHYGRKILCCMKAYGFDRRFCQFFVLQSDCGTAVIMLQNAAMLISSRDDFTGDTETGSELSLFVEMHMPFRVEGCQSLLKLLSLGNYQKLARSVFQLKPGGISPLFDTAQINEKPRLDDVYLILSEGFPNLISYPLWLTDTSHMVRHGFRQCFTYFNVTTASAVYDYQNHVLIGQVATRREARGKGYARDFLHWIANRLDEQGKTGILYALDIRKSFYQEIGFDLIESEFVWERLHEAEPDAKKGVL